MSHGSGWSPRARHDHATDPPDRQILFGGPFLPSGPAEPAVFLVAAALLKPRSWGAGPRRCRPERRRPRWPAAARRGRRTGRGRRRSCAAIRQVSGGPAEATASVVDDVHGQSIRRVGHPGGRHNIPQRSCSPSISPSR